MKKLKEIYLKNRSHLIIGASVILIFTAVLEIYFAVAVRVSSNDECLWTLKKVGTDSTAIFFSAVKVGGVTWNAGIRNGDELLGINNQKFSDPLAAQEILNKVKAGDYADYTVKKKNRIVHTKVYVKKLIQPGNVANGILALMQMIIAFIVLMAKPDGRVQKIFYATGVAAVLASTFIFIPTTFHSQAILANPFGYLIGAFCWSLGGTFFPFLFLAFFLNFPKPFAFMEKKFVRAMLFILPLIYFLTIFSFTVDMASQGKFAIDRFNALRGTQGLISSIIYITAFITLIISYFRLKTREDRRPVLIILIAYLLAIISVVYTARIAPAISDTIFNSPQYYTPIILVVLVPIAFAYSILKYQLLDVSLVIKNTILYGVATLGLAAIYFFIIYFLGQSISEAIGTEFQGLIAGLIFILFALVFQSTKDRFQDFLTAKFYPEQFAYQKVLLKFSSDIPTVVGLDNILDSMKETFVKALMIKRFGIMIRKKKDSEFHLVRSYGLFENDIVLEQNDLDNYISQKLITSKNAVMERSELELIFPAEAVKLIDAEVYTVIPMIIKSKVIGLLLFGLKHSGSQFAGKDLDLLSAAANQAAISIENARLYELETEKLKLERDLDLARRIQQGLLPKSIPEIKGLDISGEMIPAMQVGGDYFDVIKISDSQSYIVVGDVSGKGLSASLYMTKLQTMVRLACTPGKSPKEIMIELNKTFYESIERNSFVTMTLALFDTDTKTVTFCRAGHVPVLSALNGTVFSYRTQGLGIGLEKGVVFEKTLIEEYLKLNSGQIYAFFSDGITEAMNENFELFGEEKLSELLRNKKSESSKNIMSEIWDSVSIFRGNAEQNDDMTMVLVKVT